MTTKLEQLLKNIDYEQIINQTNRDLEEVLIHYLPTLKTPASYNEFEQLLARFFHHLETQTLGITDYPLEGREQFYWGRCHPLLTGLYGPNGEKVAYERIRTGKEGGWYRVLTEVASALAEQYINAGIEGRVHEYWNSLSTNEKLAAADEYIEKYGYLLPTEMQEASGGRIRAQFTDVLIRHPRIMRRLGRIGQAF